MPKKVLVKEPVPYWLSKDKKEEQALHARHRDVREEGQPLSTLAANARASTQQFAETVPHFAGHHIEGDRWVPNTAANDNGSPHYADTNPEPLDTTGRLSKAQADAYEAERSDLLRRLPSLTAGDRAKADHRLGIIEEALKRHRSHERSDRVSETRREERQRQEELGGPSAGNTQMVEMRSTIGGRPKARATSMRPAVDPVKQAVDNLSPADQATLRAMIRREREQ